MVNRLTCAKRHLRSRVAGQALVEYASLGGVVLLVCLSALYAFGAALGSGFIEISNRFSASHSGGQEGSVALMSTPVDVPTSSGGVGYAGAALPTTANSTTNSSATDAPGVSGVEGLSQLGNGASTTSMEGLLSKLNSDDFASQSASIQQVADQLAQVAGQHQQTNPEMAALFQDLAKKMKRVAASNLLVAANHAHSIESNPEKGAMFQQKIIDIGQSIADPSVVYYGKNDDHDFQASFLAVAITSHEFQQTFEQLSGSLDKLPPAQQKAVGAVAAQIIGNPVIQALGGLDAVKQSPKYQQYCVQQGYC
ncbi:MAG: hypothetical protein SFZ03_05535 [Candidatus Melainabacteria bacterium]|nr:hypothetical protein [Candidatus Melainabacteria bacterium]